jgi:hypothetical protein
VPPGMNKSNESGGTPDKKSASPNINVRAELIKSGETTMLDRSIHRMSMRLSNKTASKQYRNSPNFKPLEMILLTDTEISDEFKNFQSIDPDYLFFDYN